MSRSIGETVRSLIGRPGEPIPSPDHLEAVRGGQEFVIEDVVIIGSRRSCTRFLLSFRCEQLWGRGGGRGHPQPRPPGGGAGRTGVCDR